MTGPTGAVARAAPAFSRPRVPAAAAAGGRPVEAIVVLFPCRAMSSFTRLRVYRPWLLAAALAGPGAIAISAEPAPAPAAGAAKSGAEKSLDDRLDPAVVYRYNPLDEKLSPIAGKDLKANNVYYRYSPARGRHVWSQVDDDGQLRYELGPGSSFPVRLFDPVADQETRKRVFEKRAPELARRFATQGARPSLRLGADGRWALDPATNEGRVFDLATGERYEWHLGRPVPVVNTGGNSWLFVDGRYRSTTVGEGGAEPVADDFCPGSCPGAACCP